MIFWFMPTITHTAKKQKQHKDSLHISHRLRRTSHLYIMSSKLTKTHVAHMYWFNFSNAITSEIKAHSLIKEIRDGNCLWVFLLSACWEWKRKWNGGLIIRSIISQFTIFNNIFNQLSSNQTELCCFCFLFLWHLSDELLNKAWVLRCLHMFSVVEGNFITCHPLAQQQQSQGLKKIS